jgi:hypothetical protein
VQLEPSTLPKRTDFIFIDVGSASGSYDMSGRRPYRQTKCVRGFGVAPRVANTNGL